MRRLPVKLTYKSGWLPFTNALLAITLLLFMFGMFFYFFVLYELKNGLIFVLFFVFCLYALYLNNIFKSIEIFKEKIIINLHNKTQILELTNASLEIKSRNYFTFLIFKNLQTNKKLYEINLSFFTNEDKKILFETLAEISHRNVNEFENYPKFETFLKKLI